MTEERIAELRALADAATPGPWAWKLPYDYGFGMLESLEPTATGFVAEDAEGHGGIVVAAADAAFIAAARTALPEVLDAIARVRKIAAASSLQSGAVGEYAAAMSDVLAALDGEA